MQAAPVIAAMPQAPADISARPAGSDGNKTRFTEYLSKRLNDPAQNTAPSRAAEKESAERPEEDRPDEEKAAEMAGAMAQIDNAQVSGEIVLESAETEGGMAVEGLADPAWAAPAEVSGGGAAAQVHVEMVREKIAEILEADLASLAEPETVEQVPEAADAAGAEETGDAPAIDTAPSGETSAPVPVAEEQEADSARPALTGGNEREAEDAAQADKAHGARSLAGAAAAASTPSYGAMRVEAQIRAEAAERALMRFSQDLLELRTGVREIRITLEPESLGELTISVMKTDAGVSARIFSPDRDVCSAVADKLPVLLQSIEQNGLTMQELEIIHAPADFAGNAAQTGQSGRQGGRRGQTFRAVASAAARDDESAFWSGFHQSGRPDDATVVYRV